MGSYGIPMGTHRFPSENTRDLHYPILSYIIKFGVLCRRRPSSVVVRRPSSSVVRPPFVVRTRARMIP